MARCDVSITGKLLVVDDDAGVRFYLEEVLARDGYKVVAVESGEAALQCIEGEEFDLALVDLVMRGMDGMSLVAALRERAPSTAIIVLTAHASVETAVEALRHGAHDYLFKPCTTSELRASIRGGLAKRQSRLSAGANIPQDTRSLSDGSEEIKSVALVRTDAGNTGTVEESRVPRQIDLVVDLTRHKASLQGQSLELSPTEFGLLAYLLSESPRVVSPQELVREVQGYESEPWEARDTVRYHIYRIRRKIEETTGCTDVIRTVRGVGYAIGKE
jgi:DNA-binding response OmpR family regulator